MPFLFDLKPCLALLVLFCARVLSRCPSRDYSWCLQIDGYDNVILDGNRFAELKPVFGHISHLLSASAPEDREAKRFDQFLLFNNQEVRRLEANTFHDLQFTRLVLKNCTKLVRIDPQAFNGTQDQITRVHIDLISISGQQNILDFFDALNSLRRLEELELFNHNVITIPEFAFRQPLLSRLELDGPLNAIHKNAFFHLDSLRILKLTKSVKHVPKHAFDFKTPTNKTLDVYFDIKWNSMESGVFTHVLRPITLNLYLKKLRDFSEHVFGPILRADIRHDIIFHGQLKDMANRCVLFWLFDPQFHSSGRFSFKTDPQISGRDFQDCPADPGVSDGSHNGLGANASEAAINAWPIGRSLCDRSLVLLLLVVCRLVT